MEAIHYSVSLSHLLYQISMFFSLLTALSNLKHGYGLTKGRVFSLKNIEIHIIL